MSTRAVRIVAACVLQLLLVVGAVWPSLSARLTGDEILLEVEPVDPVDPFRGAYVALTYPALEQPEEGRLQGRLFVPLVPVPGGHVWAGRPATAQRPSGGRYLSCDSDGWQLSCGIESLFAPQDEALRLEQQLVSGAVARIRVDDRGNAAVVAVDPAP